MRVFLLLLVMLVAPALASGPAEEEFLRTHNYTFHRGLAIVPGVFELVELIDHPPLRPVTHRILESGFGLNLVDGKPIGLFEFQEDGFKMGVFGCVACHSSKAAGKFYVGLGNKSIDVASIGHAILKFEKPYRWTKPLRGADKQAIVDRAFAFAHDLAHPLIENSTRGMVSINHVNRWFWTAQGLEIPETLPRGGAKVPALYGIKAKATEEGLFYDGLGAKGSIAWLALPELAAGQTPENLRADFHRIERLWETITQFDPPLYPFDIKRAELARGAAVYAKSCQECHGTYEREATGAPIYKAPHFCPLDMVGTDPDRARASTPELRSLIAKSPLADLVTATDRPAGYFAPRLDAIWARFPYLHNGSVPTLADLLLPPGKRPHFWSLDRPGDRDRFDDVRIGYTLPPASSIDASKLEALGHRGARDIYDVSRPGHSNAGHDFGTDLPEADRAALLEYLKTL